MLGYEPDELIGKRLQILMHTTDRTGRRYSDTEWPIRIALIGGKEVRVEDAVFNRKDRSTFDVEYTLSPIVKDGEVRGAVIAFEDVTDRLHAQEALRQTEEKYRLIHENAVQGIYQSTPEGRFLGRHPLPDRTRLAATLGALGVGAETLLVAYDEADGMYASRLWWLSLWLGHARVAVLDGGLRAWQAAGLPVSREVPTPAPRKLPVHVPLVATVEADEIERSLGTSRLRVIDARAAERYRGDVEPLDARAGHIPGALNRPFKTNVDAEGRFRPAAELRSALEPLVAGVSGDAVVSQCGSGVTACHNILAMMLAGFAPPRLYAGSWSEWSSSPSRPVATGAQP